MAKSARPKTPRKQSTTRNSRATVGGPATSDASGRGDALAEKFAGTQDLASAFPFNPNKAAEYDPEAALAPHAGASRTPDHPLVGSSTVTEVNGQRRLGAAVHLSGTTPRPDHSIAYVWIPPTAR